MTRATTSLTLSLAIGVAAVGCQSEQSAEPAPTEREPVNVAVVQISPGGFTDRIEVAGILEPWTEVEVSAELGGRLSEVRFREGQFVEKGTLLAKVGTDLFEAGVAEAEAALLGAEAVYEKAEKLFEKEAVPRQELLAATSRYRIAQAQVTVARLRLDRSVIVAPISGVCVSREVEPGEVLSPGALITRLHRLDRLKAASGLPESDVAAFSVGGGAVVRVDAIPDREFTGKIHFISSAGNGPSRTFPVDVALDNRDGALRPGMIGRVELVRRQLEGVIAVERDVLQERDQGTVAVVLDGDVARVRPVVVGAVDGNRVHVESGLSAGDWLIVAGHRNLSDGQPVHVAERTP